MMPPKVEKNKICLVAISLGKGGAERSCAMLSQMLTKKGYEVCTVILNDEVENEYGGKLFNLGKFKNGKDTFLKRLLRFKKLRNFLKAENFGMIIDHRSKNKYLRELFYDRYLYKNQNRIYVTHSSKKEQYLTEKPESFVRICNKNKANVAVSNYIEKEILKKSGIEKTVTIHNAYNLEWGKAAIEKPEILKDKTYILSYGRLEDDIKDFSFLIEAFSLSEVWKKEVFLVILGDGKDGEKLKKRASEKRCAAYILFVPFTQNPFPYIANARCVTLTSKYEGFPMVLVEGLSLGTPVISLDIISGPSEIVQHEKNGLLIGERNISLFGEALRKICFDASFYQRLKMNTKSSVSQFSMETIAEKWNQLLQNGTR